jgi:hypothetical protein
MTAEQTMRLACAAKAQSMWATFTADEKLVCRFGMFPAGPMREAEAEGFDGHFLALGLMDCAQADGGMRA